MTTATARKYTWDGHWCVVCVRNEMDRIGSGLRIEDECVCVLERDMYVEGDRQRKKSMSMIRKGLIRKPVRGKKQRKTGMIIGNIWGNNNRHHPFQSKRKPTNPSEKYLKG